MGRQVFTAGEILTAANMNDLSDQSVMVFDDASARTTAIPTPVEGMVTYLEDVGGAQGLEVFDGAVFTPVAIVPDPPIPPKILQVVSTLFTGSFFSGGLSQGGESGFIPDFDLTITPSSVNSKIVIFVTGGFIRAQTGLGIYRNGSRITALTGNNTNHSAISSSSPNVDTMAANFVDTPASTSPVLYQFTMFQLNTGSTVSVGLNNNQTASSIIAMEVTG